MQVIWSECLRAQHVYNHKHGILVHMSILMSTGGKLSSLILLLDSFYCKGWSAFLHSILTFQLIISPITLSQIERGEVGVSQCGFLLPPSKNNLKSKKIFHHWMRLHRMHYIGSSAEYALLYFSWAQKQMKALHGSSYWWSGPPICEDLP